MKFTIAALLGASALAQSNEYRLGGLYGNQVDYNYGADTYGFGGSAQDSW